MNRLLIGHSPDADDAFMFYALQFGRGIDRETCRRFVRMYVNEDTVDIRKEGRRSLEKLYGRAAEMGLIAAVPPLDIIQV
jgi:predicted solute-binding protein